ncbi:monooxygenase, partial [Penicillium canescens]
MNLDADILDNDYIRTLRNPRIKLINDSIAQVSSNSVVIGLGNKYPADFIIVDFGDGIRVHAIEARRYDRQDDQGGIGAYKTVAMNEFPNIFYLLGPNSGSGHTSVLFAIECSVNPASIVEVSKGAEVEWYNTIQTALSKTVLTRTYSS